EVVDGRHEEEDADHHERGDEEGPRVGLLADRRASAGRGPGGITTAGERCFALGPGSGLAHLRLLRGGQCRGGLGPPRHLGDQNPSMPCACASCTKCCWVASATSIGVSCPP